MKISILIGAGASYGNYIDDKKGPPLGTALFEVLEKKYPESWGKISLKKIISNKKDFETIMTEIWQNQDENTARQLIDMGLFFAEFNPVEDDNYSQLIKALHGKGLLKDTGFGSLNYDCIFEISACRLGFKLDFGLENHLPENILILKPHGSCNFIPSDELNVSGITFIQSGGGGYLDGPIQIADLDKVRNKYIKENQSIPPAMSLYAPGKFTPTGAAFISKQKDDWKKIASESEYIITIGTNPNLNDDHIWGPIIKSGAKVFFVGGKSEEVKKLEKILDDRFEQVGERFLDFTSNINNILSRITL